MKSDSILHCLRPALGLILGGLISLTPSAGSAAPGDHAPRTPRTAFRPDQGLATAIDRAVRSFDVVERQGQKTYSTEQPRQGYLAEFTSAGSLTLRTGKSRLGVRALAFGRGATRNDLGTATTTITKDAAGWPSLRFNRANLSEWYVNGANDLHHWLQVASRPDGNSGNLWVRLALSGATNIKSISDQAVEVRVSDRVLTYGGLKVWDASGKVLPSRLVATGSDVSISVDDRGALYPVTIDPSWVQQQKLTSGEGSLNDRFGSSVALDGDTVAIGAPNRLQRVGVVYVFTRTAGAWSLTQKVTASDGASNDYFGCSVALAGDTLLVGAYGQKNFTGAVYAFTRSGGTFGSQAKYVGTGAAEFSYFGFNIALSGNTFVTGADGQASDRGLGFIYVRSNPTAAWTLQARVVGADSVADDSFGWSVGVSGDSAIFGSPNKDLVKGAAYLFTRTGNAWKQTQKLSVSDGLADDSFGYDVAIQGDTALVGAFGRSADLGAVYLYGRATGTWSLAQTLTPSDPTSNSYFGSTVGINDGLISIGSSVDAGGTVVLFAPVNGVWTQGQTILAYDGGTNDSFGQTFAFSKDTAIISSIDNDQYRGAAYAFSLATTSINLAFDPSSVLGGANTIGTITLSAPAPSGGLTVALSDDNTNLTVPGSVTVAEGAKTATFTATTVSVPDDVTVTVTATASDWTTGTATVKIKAPTTLGLTIDPTSLKGGGDINLTITISKPAPVGGLTVALSSNQTSVQPPATAVVPEGTKTVTVTGTTSVVTNDTVATVTASASGWTNATATVTLFTLQDEGLRIDPLVVTGGTGSTGTYTRTTRDSTNEATVTLSSNNAAVSVPASVTLGAGVSVVTFPITTTAVAKSVDATITATRDTAKFTAVLTVNPAVLTGITVSPTTIFGSSTARATVKLNGPAPTGGAKITLTSDNTAVAFPATATVTVAAGAKEASFNVTTKLVAANTTVNIGASLGDVQVSAPLTVSPATVDVFIRPQIFVSGDGRSVIGRIKLSFPAAKPGITFTLSSSDPALTLATRTTLVHTGSDTASFTLKHTGVPSRRVVTITATSPAGTGSGSCTLLSNKLTGFSVSPTSVKGGSATKVTGTVSVLFAAQEGGLLVTLESYSRKVGVPDFVIIPKGSKSVTFDVTHSTITTRLLSVGLKATCLGSKRTARLKLTR